MGEGFKGGLSPIYAYITVIINSIERRSFRKFYLLYFAHRFSIELISKNRNAFKPLHRRPLAPTRQDFQYSCTAGTAVLLCEIFKTFGIFPHDYHFFVLFDLPICHVTYLKFYLHNIIQYWHS